MKVLSSIDENNYVMLGGKGVARGGGGGSLVIWGLRRKIGGRAPPKWVGPPRNQILATPLLGGVILLSIDNKNEICPFLLSSVILKGTLKQLSHVSLVISNILRTFMVFRANRFRLPMRRPLDWKELRDSLR